MKFQLIIDTHKDEEVVVTANKRSALTDALEALVTQHSGTDRLPCYTDDGMQMLPFSQMECISVLDGKTYAIASDGRQYRLKLRLYELEKLLPSCFIRINKSSLANETRIARFAATFSGGVDAVFRSGYREYVSRRCFAAIKRRYEQL